MRNENQKYYFAHDTETGGFDVKKCKLLEIGSAVFDMDGNEVISFQSFLNFESDGKSANMTALKINNYFERKITSTKEDAPNHIVADRYAKFCIRAAQLYNPVLLGQNIGFDTKFTDEFMAAHGYMDWSDLFSYHKIDTCVLGYQLIDAGIIRAKSPSLKNLCEALNIENPCAHGALTDARSTAKVYFAMRKIFRELADAKGFANNAEL